MNEWKRVFLDPRRLGLLLLTALLSLGAFFLSWMDDATLDSARRTAASNAYASRLVAEWRGRDPVEIASLAEAERERILNARDWYFRRDGAELPFDTDEEARASVADLPGLIEAGERRDYDEFYDTMMSFYDAAEALGREAAYLAGYGEYLAGIQSQAEIQSRTSLFGRPGSFANRNLAKTAADFGNLLDVRVDFGNNRGLERWLAFDLGDYLHMAAMAVLAMSFQEERRRGLWPVVRASRGGRGRLAMTRLAILVAGSALATALYSLLPLLVSLWIHGGGEDLGRSIQSVESFGTCPLKITVLAWLPRYFALKVLSGALIGLFLWVVLGSVANPQFSVAVLGTTLALELIFYEALPIQSFLNVLKYFNIFAYVHTASLYTEYLNVDLFGFPVGIRALALGGLPVFGLAFATWAVLLQTRRRPQGNRDHLSRLSAPVNRTLDRLRTRLTLTGWEGYKSLAFQYGLLLMALVFLAGSRLAFLDSEKTSWNHWVDAYLTDMEGPIDADTDEYLRKARALASDSDNEPELLTALDRVEARVSELRQRAEEGGWEPWVADTWDYDICYGPQSQNKQRLNAAVAILLTALLTASLWPFERQAGVVPMLRSTAGGRRRLFRRKVLTASLLAVFVWGCVYIRELLLFLRDYPKPTTLSAPVQNLDALADFPLPVTLGQYLALLYALRLLMLVGVAQFSLAAGSLCPNVRSALLAVPAALGIPALLTVLGAELFKWVSPVVPVASAELMWGLGSGRLAYTVPWLAWLAAVSASTLAARRGWVRG